MTTAVDSLSQGEQQARIAHMVQGQLAGDGRDGLNTVVAGDRGIDNNHP
jgi:hypothetical protein